MKKLNTTLTIEQKTFNDPNTGKEVTYYDYSFCINDYRIKLAPSSMDKKLANYILNSVDFVDIDNKQNK